MTGAEFASTVGWLGVLVGATATAWGLTLVAAAYAGYRYVYQPWKVMRADVRALRDQLEALQAEIGLRRAVALTDEEQALIERRARARTLWSASAGGRPGPRSDQ